MGWDAKKKLSQNSDSPKFRFFHPVVITFLSRDLDRNIYALDHRSNPYAALLRAEH
ncbi:hypothetical protein BAZMOX_06810_1 [methanotrophic endosymbiont of Bathymodiolus azoricus (Menez Gwen)]|nr:hypothetical protein BAZMOX_06810_1 [methanotrophic endosymbiont of Bathymodiolus azoricus (Menez Gwen)]